MEGELRVREGGDGVRAGFFDGAWSSGLLGEVAWRGVLVWRLGRVEFGLVVDEDHVCGGIVQRGLGNGWLADWRTGRGMVVNVLLLQARILFLNHDTFCLSFSTCTCL